MSCAEKPSLHTKEQEEKIREMVNPVLEVVEAEYGSWGLDCVREFCQGRIIELHQQVTHKT